MKFKKNKIIENLNKIQYYNEKGGKINTLVEEIDEQTDAANFIKEDDVVLEVGARYGTVSNVINTILKNKKNHVAVEPDITVIDALKKNRDNHHCDYHIFNGYISNKKKKIVYANYGTTLENYNPLLDAGKENTIEYLSYQDFKKKYNLKFNVLVVDCEGCMQELIDDIGDDIKNYDKVFFEKDYPNKTNYKYIREILLENNFKIVKYGFRPVYIKDNNLELIFPKTKNMLKIRYTFLYDITNHVDADQISKIILKHCKNNITILDGTAGCGGNTFSFSKYFKHVHAFENNKNIFNMLKNNILIYELKNVTVLQIDSIQYIFKYNKNFNVLFLDPTYPYIYNNNKLYKINIILTISGFFITDIINFIKKNNDNILIVIKLDQAYDLSEFEFKYIKYVINNFIILIF